VPPTLLCCPMLCQRRLRGTAQQPHALGDAQDVALQIGDAVLVHDARGSAQLGEVRVGFKPTVRTG